MTLRLNVDPLLRGKLKVYLEEAGLDILLDEVDGLTVKPGNKENCTADTLYQQGRITCKLALELASEYQISPVYLGKLLNHLQIKIKSCSLGCF